MPMKALFLLIALFVVSCVGHPVETGDPWQGMTPAQYADQAWAKPDKVIPDELSRSGKKALMQLFEFGAIAAGAAF